MPRLTISTPSKPRVNTGTECSSTFFAVSTPPICHVERHDNAVSLFQQCDSLA